MSGELIKKPRRWTGVEDKLLRELLAAGQKPEQVGARLGRSKESVQCRAYVLRSRLSDAKNRPCLCCGEPFFSAWKGNRLCPYCARQAQGVSPYAQ